MSTPTGVVRGFCGQQEFWDSNLTWYTDSPEFTQCFQQSIFVSMPCCLFSVIIIIKLWTTLRHRTTNHPFPWLGTIIAKLVLSVILIGLSVSELLILSIQRHTDSHMPETAMYLSSCSKIVVHVLVLSLIMVNKKRAIKSSTVLTLFWLLMSVCGVIIHRSTFIAILYKTYSAEQTPRNIIDVIYFPFIYVQFFLSLFSDAEARKNTEDPFEEAPFFSFITFHWFNCYIFAGMKKLFTITDLAPLPKNLRAEYLWKRFSNCMKRGKESKEVKEVSAIKLMNTAIRASYLNFTYAVITHFIGVALIFAPPLLLDLLITYLSGTEYVWRGFFYAILLFISQHVQGSANAISFFYGGVFSVQTKSALSSSVYRKSLKLSSSSRKGYTCGEMVNILSVDIEKIGGFLNYFPFVFGSPFRVIVTLFLLWQYIGPACIAGVLFICMLLVVNTFVIRKSTKIQTKQMKTKDARLKFLTEILNGVKVLKFYAWEIPFMKKIADIRQKEVNLIRIYQLFFSFCSFVWNCSPFMIAVVSFTTYTMIGSKNVLDPRIVFVSLNLLNILRYAVMDIPVLTSDLVQLSVSLKRISKFLSSEEMDEIIGSKPDDGEAVSIKEASFAWERNEEPNLKNIDFHAKKGTLIAVIGPVGSGKSSLLSAMLGEMYKLNGCIDVEGSYAYVPQQAWVMNQTVKDNILFVKPMDRRKYNKVLEACSLISDLEILPGGDETEIGEKGINLSGGQKQRVSLARAIYHDADIYLLDDPLSAVDAHVGKHIFEHVIGNNGLLKQKTRILVTHNISYLHQADFIYTVRDGKIEETGTYDELMERAGLFAELIQEFTHVKSNANTEKETSFGDGIEDEVAGFSPSLDRQLSKESTVGRVSVNSVNVAEGALIEEEKMEVGKVRMEAFLSFGRNMGLPFLVVVFIGYFSAECFEIGSTVWLSEWSNDPALPDGSQNIPLRNKRLGVYAAIGLGQCLMLLLGVFSLAIGAARASKLFHKSMLDSVMRSPMSFFDTTPLGRIVNRFGRDINDIDSGFASQLDGFLACFLSALGTLIVIAYTTPIFLAFLIPISGLYYLIQKYFLVTSRQLKRLQSVTRSPLISYFTESIQGSSSILSYAVQKQFILKFEQKLDTALMCEFYWETCNRWLQFRLSVLGNTIALIAAVLVVYSRNHVETSTAAMSLNYSLLVNTLLIWLVRTSTELENKSVSIERVNEYSKLPSEAPWDIPDTNPGSSWPNIGNIKLNNYSTRYRDGLELSLRDVTLDISKNEKVGIVGRTGAGKSSLTLALFRILEPAGGSIVIDDIDIVKIGLHQLRSKLTIIPQDPVLFTGELRLNLDPNDCYTDEELWSCLEQANLKSFVKSLPEGLQHEISEGGSNLSVGQRQLVCLARALLKKTKILILDEATAAVDVETDQLIQNTIRNEFKDHTVITVAHRLNTIMDYDRIVVMEDGQVVEIGSPGELLEDQHSRFNGMAKDARLI